MYIFYAVMILCGVLMTIVAIFLYIIDKRKSMDLMLRVEEKNNELTQAIQDAEQIVLEMNRFSDYLLGRVDEKLQEVEACLEKDLKAKEDILHLQTRNQAVGSEDKWVHWENNIQRENRDIQESMRPTRGQQTIRTIQESIQGKVLRGGTQVDELVKRKESEHLKLSNTQEFSAKETLPSIRNHEDIPNNGILNHNQHVQNNRIDVKLEGTPVDLKELYIKAKNISPQKPKAENVCTLKEDGWGDIDIAKELDMGIGEVRLILGMKS